MSLLFFIILISFSFSYFISFKNIIYKNTYCRITNKNYKDINILYCKKYRINDFKIILNYDMTPIYNYYLQKSIYKTFINRSICNLINFIKNILYNILLFIFFSL